MFQMQESTIIEGDAHIGDNCVLDKRVVIEKHAIIGKRCENGRSLCYRKKGQCR